MSSANVLSEFRRVFAGSDPAPFVALKEELDAAAPGEALPTQTGHDGEILTTDGTDASWTPVALPDGVLDWLNGVRDYAAGARLLRAAGMEATSTPEEFKLSDTLIIQEGGYVRMADPTTENYEDLTFTEAHVITGSKYGAIIVGATGDGPVVSFFTTVVASPQAYDTWQEAYDAARALADTMTEAAMVAGNVGDEDFIPTHIFVISNSAGDWTANTDSLSDDIADIDFEELDGVMDPPERLA